MGEGAKTMKNQKQALELMQQAMKMLQEENYPASEDQMYQAKAVQNSMDMGAASPNKPNLEDDAMAKSTGGFVSNSVANGEGQDEAMKKELRKKAMIQKYAKTM